MTQMPLMQSPKQPAAKDPAASDSKSSRVQAQSDGESSDTVIPPFGIVLICIFAGLFVISGMLMYTMIQRERQGNPIFTSLLKAEYSPGVEITEKEKKSAEV